MKQSNKAYLFMGFVFVFALGLVISSSMITPNNVNSQEGVNYQGDVCVTHRNADGKILSDECSHNVLFTTGAEAIEDYLADGSGGGDAFDWIELCDATNATCGNPIAASSEAWTAWTDSGLSKAVGAVQDNGDGSWNVWKTFTSTADGVLTNVTHLTNDDDDEFAGNNFTLATLQDLDTITVNWTLSVS